MQVGSLGWEDPFEKGMATHSSILAWRIWWIEEPCEWAIVHRVAKSPTQLKQCNTHAQPVWGKEDVTRPWKRLFPLPGILLLPPLTSTRVPHSSDVSPSICFLGRPFLTSDPTVTPDHRSSGTHGIHSLFPHTHLICSYVCFLQWSLSTSRTELGVGKPQSKLEYPRNSNSPRRTMITLDLKWEGSVPWMYGCVGMGSKLESPRKLYWWRRSHGL